MDALIELLEELRETNSVTIMIRVVLAAVAGAIIGLEREVHGRAAGLRTHIIVSLGAALCAVIGCYISSQMIAIGVNSDAQRIGAQVVSGLGFLCAGTILFKKSNSQITGLTTAAGIWSTAAIGLAVGYGLYEAALVAVIIMLLSFTVLAKFEYRMNSKRQTMLVYIEIDAVENVKAVYAYLRDRYDAHEIQVTAARTNILPHVGIEAVIKVPQKKTLEERIEELSNIDHAIFAMQIT